MTRVEIERLLAMLCNDQTDPGAYEFVVGELFAQFCPQTPPRTARTEAQTVDPFESGLPNDPRYW